MPTSDFFSKAPAFPVDASQANLSNISLLGLEKHEEPEIKRLYSACCRDGFFKLSLHGSKLGEALIAAAMQVYEANTETFALGRSELASFAYKPPKDLSGYKAAGDLKTDDGKLDAMQMFTINQDDVLDSSCDRRFPQPLETRKEQMHDFFAQSGRCVAEIMNALDNALGLPTGTLAGRCALNKPSATSLRLLLSNPSTGTLKSEGKGIALGGHTDIGLITFLFNVVGGLQILPANVENSFENWRFIKPEAGFVIVNLGDTIVEWTGGLLRSSLHRVVAPPGEQANYPRQSLAYLVRPAREATMARLTGGSSIVPPLSAGQTSDDRSVTEWAAERASQIIKGELRPRTTGGLGAS